MIAGIASGRFFDIDVIYFLFILLYAVDGIFKVVVLVCIWL